MNGQVRWWQLLIFVLMVLVYGLVGTDDLEHMQRAEAMRGAVYAINW